MKIKFFFLALAFIFVLQNQVRAKEPAIDDFYTPFPFELTEISGQVVPAYPHRNFPELVVPGDNFVTLDNESLQILLPSLKKPRLSGIDDIPIDNRFTFFDQGMSFVVRNDFNGDGLGDVAVLGKYDGAIPYHRFITIFTHKEKKIIRNYLVLFDLNKAYLMFYPKVKNYNNVIILSNGTDMIRIIRWNGKKYVMEDFPRDWPDYTY